jgi:hypothetical protein
MTAETRSFVLFQTDLFVSVHRDEDIDCFSLGADCAGWFYTRLLASDGITADSDPVMEDWGWTMAVGAGGARVRMNIWVFFDLQDAWLIGLEPVQGLFRRGDPGARELVAEALEGIIRRDPRIRKHRWFAKNPFELDGVTL